MPIYLDSNGKVIVEFGGDIFINGGIQNDRGVMRLTQGSPGEIGRDISDIKINLSPENAGVILVAKDHRSLGIVIRNLTKIMNAMKKTDDQE